jgi:ribosomal protein S18 acetylase RimI-like enzyme
MPADLPGIVQLMERVYPPPHPAEAVWSIPFLQEHLRRFPEGQILAEAPDGSIIGDSTSLRVRFERAMAPHTWDEITGMGTLRPHDPQGEVFYGVDIVVDPALRGRGVGSALYQARIRLARKLGCSAFVAGVRIPGYHEAAAELTPERYVKQVEAGFRVDPTLSKQLHLGFHVVSILPGYFPDFESLDYAVLILKPLESR